MGDNFDKINNSTINNRSVINASDANVQKNIYTKVIVEKSSLIDPWYKKPIGLVVLGVIIAILAGFIKYYLKL